MLKRTNRILKTGDPVYLELFIGLLTFLIGVLFGAIALDKATRNALIINLDFIAPVWVWSLAMIVTGLIQIVSTIFEISLLMIKNSYAVVVLWFCIFSASTLTMGILRSPMATVICSLVIVGELSISIWQSKRYERTKHDL